MREEDAAIRAAPFHLLALRAGLVVGDLLRAAEQRFVAGQVAGDQPADRLPHHLGGAIAEDAFAGRVEGAHQALAVDGDDGADRGVQDGPGQGQAGGQFLLGGLAFGDVRGDAQVAADLARDITHGGHHQADVTVLAVAADEGPLTGVGAGALGALHQHAEPGDRQAVLGFQGGALGGQFSRQMEVAGLPAPHHLGGVIAQQALGAFVEQGDQAVAVGGDDAHLGGRAQHVAEQAVGLAEFGGALGHLLFQPGIERQDLGLSGLLQRDVAHRLGGAGDPAVTAAHGRDADQHIDEAAVAVLTTGLEVRHRLAAADAFEHRPFLVLQLGGHHQVEQALAHGFAGGVAEQLFRRMVPAQHHALEVLADDAVGRAFHHRGEVGLVLLVLAAPLAGGEQGEGQTGGQQAEQLAEQVHQRHRDQVLGGDEGRGGGERQLPLATIDLLHQLSLGQLLNGFLFVLALAIEQAGGLGNGHVAQADDDAGNVQAQAADHLLNAQGHIGPSQGGRLAGGRIGRWAATLVDRQQHQKAGLRRRGGLQLQRTGQMNVGVPHGQHGGLATDGIGRRIHADGLQIAPGGFQVLDDVAIACMGDEGMDGEVGRAIGTGLGEKGGLFALRHAADEADAAGTAKFLAQVMDAAIIAKQLARQIAPGDHHHIAHADQAVFVDAQPIQHLIANVVGDVIQGAAQLLIVALGQMAHGQTGQQDAEQKDAETPAYARGCAQPAEHGAPGGKRCHAVG